MVYWVAVKLHSRLEDVPSQYCRYSTLPPGGLILQLLWLPAAAQVALKWSCGTLLLPPKLTACIQEGDLYPAVWQRGESKVPDCSHMFLSGLIGVGKMDSHYFNAGIVGFSWIHAWIVVLLAGHLLHVATMCTLEWVQLKWETRSFRCIKTEQISKNKCF